jgi:hypothetical protein
VFFVVVGIDCLLMMLVGRRALHTLTPQEKNQTKQLTSVSTCITTPSPLGLDASSDGKDAQPSMSPRVRVT